MKSITVVGIDIAKNVFHAVGLSKSGKVLIRRKLYRNNLSAFVKELGQGVTIAMESCGGSNYWGREFQALGNEVKLIAPQFVKPYVKSNKNDMADAEAIAEAASRPTMRFVPVKSVEQQDIQSLHRVRERLVKARTALTNEVRGLLAEYGIVLPKTISRFRRTYLECISDENNVLSSLCRETFRELYEEFVALDTRIDSYDKKITAIAKSHPECVRLMTIPGVGPITASAVIAAVGDMSTFKNSRAFAAWLGLVPRQVSTGGKTTLAGISKRGDGYIRKLLVHGARCRFIWLKDKDDRLSVWCRQLRERRGSNKATVALANKTARIIWAVLAREEDYKPFPLAA